MITACGNNKNIEIKSMRPNKNIIVLKLEKDLSNNSNNCLYTVIDTMEYILPELTSESIIGEYSKIIIDNNKLFIMDNSIHNKAVFIFNSKGKFLSKIASLGQGPEEYTTIHDFYYDSENELIGILSQSNILRYRLDGSFKDRINLKQHMISEITYANGALYAYSTPYCASTKCYSLLVFDKDFNLIYEDYPQHKNIINFPLAFGKKMICYGDGSSVFFNAINNDTIYKITTEFIQPEYIIDIGQYKYSKENFTLLVDRGNKAVSQYSTFMDSKYVLFGIGNIFVSHKYIYLSFLRNKKDFHTFYSIESGNYNTFTKNTIPTNILPFREIKAVYDNKYYAIADNDLVRYLRDRDEIEGVPELPDEHPRKIRYNKVLKNYNPDNNDLIAVFTIKPF